MKNGELFTLGGWFERFNSTKDAYKITIGIPVNQLGRDQIGALTQLGQHNKEGFFMLKTAEFDPEEEDAIQSATVEPDDQKKTPAQLMRAKFYVLWKMKDEGYVDFELYYRFKMGQLNDAIQKRIDALKT